MRIARRLTDVLDLFPVVDPGPHVPPDGTLEDFEQETEEGAGESGVPTAFGGFVADESVLGLDFEELWEAERGRGLVREGEEEREGRRGEWARGYVRRGVRWRLRGSCG